MRVLLGLEAPGEVHIGPGELRRLQRGRGGVFDPCLADHPIQTFIGEEHAAFSHDIVQTPALALPLHAPDFENVGEVRAELERHGHIDRLEPEILQTQGLIADSVPEKLGTEEMQRSARHDHLSVLRDIRIGEVHRQQPVVFAYGRTQEQWPVIADLQCQMREKARSVVVETLSGGLNVAVAIEDTERFALFQHAGPLIGLRRAGEDIELVFDLNDAIHGDQSLVMRPDVLRAAGKSPHSHWPCARR